MSESKSKPGAILRWTGGAWAFIGVANVVMMPWAGGNESLLGFGVLFNMMLFILPGLMVNGLGGMMARKSS